MKQAELFAAVRALPGLTVTKTADGEYRVAPRLDVCGVTEFSTTAERREAIARQEAAAYYTDDRDDALATARAMHAALTA